MKKMTTLFKKDPNDLSRVTTEIDPTNEWVFTDGVATRKFDGTACAIINGELYKRYDAKKGKIPPEGAIPCQDADSITGHHPHWVKVTLQDKWHNSAFHLLNNAEDGTYELIGEKVQGNPEKIKGHMLIPHGRDLVPLFEITYENIKKFFEKYDYEGIVFHDKSGQGRMCKIRKSDFGMKRS